MASPGGTVYTLKKGTGKLGYEGVYAVADGKFHVKLRLDAASRNQTTIPGEALSSPAEAALRLAKFRANPYPIVRKDSSRAPKGQGKRTMAKVCATSPSHVNSLFG